eukprot:420999_1
MKDIMNKDKMIRKKQKEKKKQSESDLKVFLESIEMGKYYSNFSKRGCDQLRDLEAMESDDLLNIFYITDWKDRKKILKATKIHFASVKKPASKKLRKGILDAESELRKDEKLMESAKELLSHNVFVNDDQKYNDKKNDNDIDQKENKLHFLDIEKEVIIPLKIH